MSFSKFFECSAIQIATACAVPMAAILGGAIYYRKSIRARCDAYNMPAYTPGAVLAFDASLNGAIGYASWLVWKESKAIVSGWQWQLILTENNFISDFISSSKSRKSGCRVAKPKLLWPCTECIWH